jgi:hypothetical protein
MNPLSRVLDKNDSRDGAIKIIAHCNVPHERCGSGYRVDEKAFWEAARIGYKAMCEDAACRGYQYRDGKAYTHEGPVGLCKSGFHYCNDICDCYDYYPRSTKTRIFRVKALGDVIVGDDKLVTNKIKIISELSLREIFKAANHGTDNVGFFNKGDVNTGDGNTGDWNKGSWNKGNSNKGDGNIGSWNKGNSNKGDGNIGSWNKGDWNKGDRNKGNVNTGNENEGNWNTGDYNKGDWNKGDHNTGFYNFDIKKKQDTVLWFFNIRTDIPATDDNIEKYRNMEPEELPHFNKELFKKLKGD